MKIAVLGTGVVGRALAHRGRLRREPLVHDERVVLPALLEEVANEAGMDRLQGGPVDAPGDARRQDGAKLGSSMVGMAEDGLEESVVMLGRASALRLGIESVRSRRRLLRLTIG